MESSFLDHGRPLRRFRPPGAGSSRREKGQLCLGTGCHRGRPSEAASLAKAFPRAFGVLVSASSTPDRVAQLAGCLNVVVLPLLQSPELDSLDARHGTRFESQADAVYADGPVMTLCR